jgi:tight adherence protein C
VQALSVVRKELPKSEVDRFIDGIPIGQERGTPLVELLHNQALDTRERQRRALIEKAASSEVAMMIPVVFLIMPITIVFALFPSFYRMTWI